MFDIFFFLLFEKNRLEKENKEYIILKVCFDIPYETVKDHRRNKYRTKKNKSVRDDNCAVDENR